ncbi:DUF4221 family protein, partial [Pararhodonellum marinum]|uniref:DUF4221 family protein n=1 Tax=Pararhodonellum marinum TaxID=2755358 RepID=UPI00188DDE36
IRNHQLIYSYDMVNDSIAWYDVFYPDDYWDKGKKLTDYSWAISNDKIILAPLYDHEMQVFDIPTGKVIDRKMVKSDAVKNFYYVNTFPSNSTDGILNRLKYDRFGTLIHDPFRSVFYRLYYPGFELEEDYSMEKLNMMDLSRPYLGVLILDEDLNTIGEHRFQKNEVYTFSNHFVGEKGLYISTNNLFNEDFSEDSFRYAVFSLEKQ